MSSLWQIIQNIPKALSSYWTKTPPSIHHSLKNRFFYQIFSYLSPSNLVQCRRVSRLWQQLISVFPRQFVLSEIQKQCNRVSYCAPENTLQQDVDRVCTALYSQLRCQTKGFERRHFSREDFASAQSYDSSCKQMQLQFLNKTEYAGEKIADLVSTPLSKVSNAFIQQLIAIQCANNFFSLSDGLYLFFKESLVSKKCFPGNPLWQEFQNFFDELDCFILGGILHKAYVSQNSEDAYCFSLLLKMAFHPPWDLSSTPLVNKEEQLKKLASTQKFFISPTRLVHLLLYRAFRFDFLAHFDRNVFAHLFAECLITIPHDQWQDKGEAILDYFERFKWHSQWWENVFSKASDPKTKEIGHCFNRLFDQGHTPRVYTASLHTLHTLIPIKNRYRVLFLFAYLHPPLTSTSSAFHRPSCVQLLTFTRNASLIHCGSSCIGVKNEDKLRRDSLLAYDRSTKTLLWEIPLQRNDLSYWRIHDAQFALMYADSSCLSLIDATEGALQRTIDMPVSSTRYDALYATPGEFIYYKTRQTLFGGTVSDQWNTQFKVPLDGDFTPQGRFISVREDYNSQMIVDNTGKKHVIPDCNSLCIDGAYLYTMDPNGYVTRQEISPDVDEFACSGPKEILLIESGAKLMGVCADGTAVCKAESVLYFIRFDPTESVSKIPTTPDCSDYFLDKQRGVFWIWDSFCNTLWSYTPKGGKKMAILPYDKDFTLRYVDPKGRLCYSSNASEQMG